MSKVYIVAAKRTAIGKFLGTIANVPAADLAATVIKNILAETKVDPAKIDEVIVGNILMAGQKQGVARQAAIKAGIPQEVPAYGLNMICVSGMKSIINAVASIKAGDGNLILAGGTESMSSSGFVMPGTIRNGHKMADLVVMDHMVTDGLTDAFQGYHMGITAENIATKYSITREEQDAFSFGSQQKAAAAIDAGKFKGEIVPVEIPSKKETIIFDTDEFVNRSTNLEKLGGLRPAFKKDGTVTAGNASGINDGAAFFVMAAADVAAKAGHKAMARVVSYAVAGVPNDVMGEGPIPATKLALKKAGLSLDQMDVIESNEAFAAQALTVMRGLGLDPAKTNPNGGAIALGHPVGCSGAFIATKALYELERVGGKYCLVTMCIGGGQGIAVIFERA